MEIVLDSLSIYIPEINVLVISDMHLGRASQERRIPVTRDEDIVEEVKELIYKYTPETVIFNGDSFHYTIPTENAIYSINQIQDAGDFKSVFIIGNHERNKENIDVVNYDVATDKYSIGEVTFTHGHIDQNIDSEIVIIGHLHPAFNSNPIYGYAEQSNQSIVILPAFNPLVSGTNITDPVVYDTLPVLNEETTIKKIDVDLTEVPIRPSNLTILN